MKRFKISKEVRGKVMEGIEVMIESDVVSVILNFDDRTNLQVDVKPIWHVDVDLNDWKTHNMKRLHQWPTMKEGE